MGESEKNALWYGEKACSTIMRSTKRQNYRL